MHTQHTHALGPTTSTFYHTTQHPLCPISPCCNPAPYNSLPNTTRSPLQLPSHTPTPTPSGSCGRCYEVRCRNGVVLGFDDKPVSTGEFFVLEEVDPTVLDTRGRPFPGNQGKGQQQQVVQCWNASSSIVVTIIDSCPAVQIKEENVSVPQRWCLGDQWCVGVHGVWFGV